MHFTVLVVNSKGVNDLEKQLEPYQENNTGDCPVEYMEFENLDEELKEQYLTGETCTYIHNGISLDGFGSDAMRNKALELNIIRPQWSDESRYSWWYEVSKTEKFKKWAESIKQTKKYKDIYESWEEYAELLSYERHEGHYGYWHNPRSRWDYHRLGGRWSGMIKLKAKVVKELPEQLAMHPKTTTLTWEWKGEEGEKQKKKVLKEHLVDMAYVGHVDWKKYIPSKKHRKNLTEHYNHLILDEKDPKRIEYLKENEMFGGNPQYYREKYKTAEDYIKETTSFKTYALLLDGEWYDSENCDGDFNAFFEKTLRELPDEALIAVYDCHV